MTTLIKCIKSLGEISRPQLTAGKSYEVVDNYAKSITILNDNGAPHNFLKENLHKYFRHNPNDPFHIY